MRMCANSFTFIIYIACRLCISSVCACVNIQSYKYINTQFRKYRITNVRKYVNV